MKKVWFTVIFILAFAAIIFAVVLIINRLQDLDENPCLMNQNLIATQRVIDGDTFELVCSGESVRLLCVDTPEKGQPGYDEAKYFLEGLILYKKLTLKPSNYRGNDTDKYGRLLRWVYITNETSGEEILVNRLILEEGYGDIMIIPPEKCDEVSD